MRTLICLLGLLAIASTADAAYEPVATLTSEGHNAGYGVAIGEGFVVSRTFGNASQVRAVVHVEPASGFGGEVGFGAVLTAPASSGDAGTKAVAVSGTTIAVAGGSDVSDDPLPRILVYERPPGGWAGEIPPTATISGPTRDIAYSLGIVGDTIVAGDPFAGDREGELHVYRRGPGGWTDRSAPDAVLRPSTPVSQAHFGTHLDFDGETVVAAAYRGPALVFRRPAGGWTADATESGRLGVPLTSDESISDVAVSGPAALVGVIPASEEEGATKPGRVDVFARPDGGWTGAVAAHSSLSAGDGAPDLFGYRVDLDRDGARAVVADTAAAQRAGALHVFEGSTLTRVARFAAPAGRLQLGTAVAAGGPYVLATSLDDDFGSARAHVFRETAPPPPPPVATPTPSPPPAPPKRVTPIALCGGVKIVLLDVLPQGRTRVRVAGLARADLKGQTVTLLRDGRRVGRAVVGPEGRFAAAVAAPPAARRLKARYTAMLADGTRSRALKLERLLQVEKRSKVAGGTRVRLRLVAPASRRPKQITILRQTTCTERTVFKTIRLLGSLHDRAARERGSLRPGRSLPHARSGGRALAHVHAADRRGAIAEVLHTYGADRAYDATVTATSESGRVSSRTFTVDATPGAGPASPIAPMVRIPRRFAGRRIVLLPRFIGAIGLTDRNGRRAALRPR